MQKPPMNRVYCGTFEITEICKIASMFISCQQYIHIIKKKFKPTWIVSFEFQYFT